MARATRVIQSPLSYPSLPVTALALDIAFTAADATNLEQTAMTAPFILLAWNSGGTPATITISSVADPQRRTGDITTYTVGAGLIAAIKFDSTVGWKQADGMLYYAASSANVKFACIAYA